MSFTYLMYFIQIMMTSFHEFSVICTIGVLAVTFMLTFAHSLPEKTDAQQNRKLFLKIVCKIANVALTVLAFFQLFISDFYLDVGDDLEEYYDDKGIKF